MNAVAEAVAECKSNDSKERFWVIANSIHVNIGEESPDAATESRQDRKGGNGANSQVKNAGVTPQDCFRSAVETKVRQAMIMEASSSPAILESQRRVGLTGKVAAASRDVYWQERLSQHGYMWEDFYRPMTFEAVLISLAARTKAHPGNRIIEYLQAGGSIFAGLVGLEHISSTFASEGFAQRVAVTTGVFVPEVRKLMMRDLDQYLANLASTALPSILTLGPNESRDGYVFFPRGPIYGYGVDEFSLDAPSYIVNIDNEDVSVDGALIEAERQFSAGPKTVESMVATARNQGKAQVGEELAKEAEMVARLNAFRMRALIKTVCEMIDGQKDGGNSAIAYINSIKSQKSVAESAILDDLEKRAKEGVKCSEPSS